MEMSDSFNKVLHDTFRFYSTFHTSYKKMKSDEIFVEDIKPIFKPQFDEPHKSHFTEPFSFLSFGYMSVYAEIGSCAM